MARMVTCHPVKPRSMWAMSGTVMPLNVKPLRSEAPRDWSCFTRVEAGLFNVNSLGSLASAIWSSP